MRAYLYFCGLMMMGICVYVVVLPILFSADDTFLVICGVIVILLTVPAFFLLVGGIMEDKKIQAWVKKLGDMV